MMNVEHEVWRAIGQAYRPRPSASLGTLLSVFTMPHANSLVDCLITLQERFGCHFHTREMDQMLTVGDLVACIEHKLTNPEQVWCGPNRSDLLSLYLRNL